MDDTIGIGIVPWTTTSSINIIVDCHESSMGINFDRTNDSSIVIDVAVNST